MTTRPRQWLGIGLIILGAVFLLDALRFLDFGEILRTFWPLLLILWGVLVLVRRTPPTHAPPVGSPSANVMGDVETTSPEDSLNHSNVFGNVSVRMTSQSFRGGKVSTVFGDSRIDLSGGGLAPGEQRLTISGVFGTCTIYLPKGAAYSVSGHTVFGSVRIPDQQRQGVSATVVYESPGYAAADRKLQISVSQVFGDVRVEG
jgi:predicted membrane protein